MTWNTIRRATAEDTERLTAAAERFIKKHAVDTVGDPVFSVECYIDQAGEFPGELAPARRAWRRAVRRALKSPNAEGIAWGYVGYIVHDHVD